MLFNSYEFFIFLPIVWFLYTFIFSSNKNLQNFILLVSSYIFYSFWDYRFLSLIFASTFVDFFAGIKIFESDKKLNKKLFLFLSLFFNLSLLGFFKYYNFFIESWINLFNSLGYKIIDHYTISIILPVGISFYTFQTISYTIDIYKDRIKPTKDFIAFATYVSFFPQLVAGPIERAKRLLPQLLNKRKNSRKNILDGFRLIIWGMFKKVVVADSLAPVVNDIFFNYNSLGGITLIIGIFYFSFQIYCDFSGYSDIAIGTSKLFGIEIMSNFKFPYFSRNIAEFWRRWHISLSTWFKDYLYIPLGGSRGPKLISIRNIFIIFIVSGFWHGANLTFIFWGFIHAAFFVPIYLSKKNRIYVEAISEKKLLPTFKEFYHILLTFFIVTFGWIFFRSENIINAFDYIKIILTDFTISENYSYLKLNFLIILLVILEWFMRFDERNVLIFKNKFFTITLVIIIILLIIINFELVTNEFIYFDF